MAEQFVSDRRRFIGAALREPGVPFVLADKDIPKKLPKGMKPAKGEELTPQQKAAETRRLKKEQAERDAAELEKKAAGNENKQADFMDASPSSNDGKVETV